MVVYKFNYCTLLYVLTYIRPPLATHNNTSSTLCLNCEGLFIDFFQALPSPFSTQHTHYSCCTIKKSPLRCFKLSVTMCSTHISILSHICSTPTYLNGMCRQTKIKFSAWRFTHWESEVNAHSYVLMHQRIGNKWWNWRMECHAKSTLSGNVDGDRDNIELSVAQE